MKPRGTLLLSRLDLLRLLDADTYIEVVEIALRVYATGRTRAPGLLHVDVDDGEFHIKAGGLDLDRPYFALKANGGFFGNGKRFGMPPVQGVILLCHAESGYPLALMDSTEITLGRTGATTAIAARHLARADARVATICGCGNQGGVQLRFLARVLPIESAYVFDIDEEKARRFAAALSAELGIRVTATPTLREAVRRSDVCITCTPSREPFLRLEDVPPGMFIAAVGADSPEKRELDPRILEASKVVTDLTRQCASVGEVRHALAAGRLSLDDIHAELSDIVTARRPGRTSDDEIIVFDATGTALQDTAAAATAYTRAIATETGTYFDFFSRNGR